MESTAENTRALVDALAGPQARYPHPVATVRVIETHISWVVLAGEHAYKIKKPLALPFVDFSTLSARHAYCRDEVRLNRRLAPAIYLGVVAITGSPEQPCMDGEGSALDYAVHMRRFDQDALFHHLLERGALEPVHMDRLATRIAAFHAALPASSADTDFGTPHAVLQPALDNFGEMAQTVRPQQQAALDELRDWTCAAFDALEPIFAARHRGGCVRECHGDLHLRNIALIDGDPVAFDCIEFNDELRWIDVMNEVAFLVMDLIDRGRADLGYRFLDGYLQASGDYDGVAVLRFYLVYRAVVRAKIHGLRAQQAGDDPREAARLEAAAEQYIALAQRLARGAPPVLILMHGFSASGKSRIAAGLLAGLGAIRVRSDVERKRLFDLDAHAHSASGVAAGIYADDASARTYERLAGIADTILAAGFAAIVDAAFLQQWQRERLRRVAMERDVPLLMVACVAATDTLRDRVQARAERGDDASEATTAVLEHQLASHDPFTPEEESMVVRCGTAGEESANVEACIERVTSARDKAGAG